MPRISPDALTRAADFAPPAAVLENLQGWPKLSCGRRQFLLLLGALPVTRLGAARRSGQFMGLSRKTAMFARKVAL
jgi:hypothetical protein